MTNLSVNINYKFARNSLIGLGVLAVCMGIPYFFKKDSEDRDKDGNKTTSIVSILQGIGQIAYGVTLLIGVLAKKENLLKIIMMITLCYAGLIKSDDF